MSTLNWYNENALRAYPFVDGSPAGVYLSKIVDARVELGADLPFDFSDETAAVALTDVSAGPSVVTLRFQYFSQAGGWPEPLEVQIPNDAGQFTAWSGSSTSGESRVRVVVVDAEIPTIGAPAYLVDRCVALRPSQAPSVRVYNTLKRGPLGPYVPGDPGVTPAQAYYTALAQYNASRPDTGGAKYFVWLPGEDVPESLLFREGYNVLATQDTANRTISLALEVGGGAGRDCTPLPGAYAGTLRAINGQPAVQGNLQLSVGNGWVLSADPNNGRLTLQMRQLSTPTACARPPEQAAPPVISGPPIFIPSGD